MPFTNDQVGIADIVPSINQLDQIPIQGRFLYGGDQIFLTSRNNVPWEALTNFPGRMANTRFGRALNTSATVSTGILGLALGQETFQQFSRLPDWFTRLFFRVCRAAAHASPFPGTNGTASSNISNTGTAAAVGGPNGMVHAFRMGSADTFIQDD